MAIVVGVTTTTLPRSLALAVTIALLGTVIGCGPGDKNTTDSAQQPVADLTAANGSATSRAPTGSAADQGRPQLRLDSSDEEVAALWAAYNSCLKSNGHKMLPARGPDSVDMEDTSPQSVAARKACANKLPLQPPELDEATNPHYQDEYRAYLSCLRAKGMKIHATEPLGSGWTYDDNATQILSDDQQTKADKDCTLKAFSGK
jgi:hypothetical protein